MPKVPITELSTPIWMFNDQWAVTSYGMECIDPYHYHIEKTR